MKTPNNLFLFDPESQRVKPGTDWPGVIEQARTTNKANSGAEHIRALGAALAGAASIQNLPLDAWYYASDLFAEAAIPPLTFPEIQSLEAGFYAIQELVAKQAGVRI